MDPLALFHPRIREWFARSVGDPTPVQAAAWPEIAAGRNVLAVAPTGSGKTLTAFLSAINSLAAGQWSGGATRVLYVSPLKALNNDIRRNLSAPLDQLRKVFEAAGEPFPTIRVETRSGDTPQADRRRMLAHPPEILVTTPESLNLLLSSKGGRRALPGIRCVILDEVHSVVGSKRGVHLITAVERLVPLCGEFQRIALSATVRPVETTAAFVGGFRLDDAGGAPRYRPRPVAVVRPPADKRYDIAVRFPEAAADRASNESLWAMLVPGWKDMIRRNRSTLFFVNNRRLCEKLAHMLNAGEAERPAYAHHGSLSREIRTAVEQKLKKGELRAVAATNSLGLGVDIGDLDEVVLVQSPPSVSSAVQRIGRAGHKVGEAGRGAFYPTHGGDLLEAAVLARAVADGDIEPIRPVENPLDVLAQMIVSMAGVERWDLDRLYAAVRTSFPYRNLSRKQFDLVLDMLAGRYADARVRELDPQIMIDRLDNTVETRRGAVLNLYLSGGVIPDRGSYHIRHAETDARIGDLDEVFVWEAKIGQVFAFGAGSWRIERITHNDVYVTQAAAKTRDAPFWIGERRGRDFHFSERLGAFLEEADDRLDDPVFSRELRSRFFMDAPAADALLDYLRRQREATNASLPHRRHVLVEFTTSGPGGAPGTQVALHLPFGLRVTRPLALALDAAYEERYGVPCRAYAGDDVVALVSPRDDVGAEDLLSLVPAARVEELLRRRLEGSGVFGAAFREAAGRALLIRRRRFGERLPLWMSRLKSKKLLQAVEGFGDFPLMLEAWRTCLREVFDMEGLKRVTADLESGALSWSETRTATPSPMCREIAWRHITDEFMYATDERGEFGPAAPSGLRPDLPAEVAFTPDLRPLLPAEVVDAFEQKRARLFPGYSPSTPAELLAWLKERLLIPSSEWEALNEAALRDHGLDREETARALAGKIVRLAPQSAAAPLVAAVENLPRLLSGPYAGEIVSMEPESARPALLPENAVEETRSAVLCEWLSFYGPREPAWIAAALGLDPAGLRRVLEDLLESRAVIAGALVRDAGEQVCDAKNYETLLRMRRAGARAQFEPLDPDALPLFLAAHQGLVSPGRGEEAFADRLERLLCLPLPAKLWEGEVFPARMEVCDPAMLDRELRESGLAWLGCGPKRVLFAGLEDRDLLPSPEDAAENSVLEDAFTDPLGRYEFTALLEKTGLRPSALSDLLWEQVWLGRIGNDAYAALRRGLENDFRIPSPAEAAAAAGTMGIRARSGRRSGRWSGRRSGRLGRRAAARFSGALPLTGNWFRLPPPDPPEDALEEDELRRERAGIVLDRYGVVFRELLARESPPFSWSNVFRALRLMELSGEVLAGYFFKGVPGPQFASQRGFRELGRTLPEDAVYWINAADPASPCGLGLAGLPKRTPGAHIVFRGRRPVLISESRGKRLTINVAPDDPDLPRFFGPLRHLLTRRFIPLQRLSLQSINNEPAGKSPYLEVLRRCFEALADHKGVTLFHKRP